MADGASRLRRVCELANDLFRTHRDNASLEAPTNYTISPLTSRIDSAVQGCRKVHKLLLLMLKSYLIKAWPRTHMRY